MTLRDVVFRLEAPDHPACAYTADREEVEVVFHPYRYADGGRPEHVVHILGPREDRDALAGKVVDASDGARRIDEGDRFSTWRLPDGTRFLAPLRPVLDSFGKDTQLEPFVVREGTVVARVIVAGDLDEGEVVRTLRAAAEKAAWPDWSLVHLTDHHPGSLARHLRDDNLSSKQMEVTKMGLALGFYDSPRGCTLETLAELFGISKAAVHNRLKTAERKIIAAYFNS